MRRRVVDSALAPVAACSVTSPPIEHGPPERAAMSNMKFRLVVFTRCDGYRYTVPTGNTCIPMSDVHDPSRPVRAVIFTFSGNRLYSGSVQN